MSLPLQHICNCTTEGLDLAFKDFVRSKEPLILCHILHTWEELLLLFNFQIGLLLQIGLKLLACFCVDKSDGLHYREYEIMFSRYVKDMIVEPHQNLGFGFRNTHFIDFPFQSKKYIYI